MLKSKKVETTELANKKLQFFFLHELLLSGILYRIFRFFILVLKIKMFKNFQ